MIHDVANLAEMRNLAIQVARKLGPRAILLLDGPMAAGKTQFTQFLVEALGGGETQSPSFAIHHSYSTAKGSVEHFDLFRLESEDDLESTGFWDFFRSSEGVIVIEWFARLREMNLEGHLPSTWPRLHIAISPVEGDHDRRRVTIDEEK